MTNLTGVLFTQAKYEEARYIAQKCGSYEWRRWAKTILRHWKAKNVLVAVK
jgi:hypothetical protein